MHVYQNAIPQCQSEELIPQARDPVGHPKRGPIRFKK